MSKRQKHAVSVSYFSELFEMKELYIVFYILKQNAGFNRLTSKRADIDKNTFAQQFHKNIRNHFLLIKGTIRQN